MSSRADLGSYSYDPSVDMSGYIPLDDRISFGGAVKVSRWIQQELGLPRGFQSSRFSWSSKQKRFFHRLSSGLTRAMFKGDRVRFLTLTSAVGSNPARLSKDFQVLRKRIEHAFGVLLQYCKINTSEGNGVIHALFVGAYIPQEWISKAWSEIHNGSVVVDIREVRLCKKSDVKSMGRYLVSQYLARQSYERMSWSWRWVCRGFVGIWRDLVSRHGLKDALVKWNHFLSLPLLRVKTAVFEGFSIVFPSVHYACEGG